MRVRAVLAVLLVSVLALLVPSPAQADGPPAAEGLAFFEFTGYEGGPTAIHGTIFLAGTVHGEPVAGAYTCFGSTYETPALSCSRYVGTGPAAFGGEILNEPAIGPAPYPVPAGVWVLGVSLEGGGSMDCAGAGAQTAPGSVTADGSCTLHPSAPEQ